MLPSGSRIGLLHKCQWWAGDVPEPPRETSAAADRGTDRHKVLAALSTGEVVDFPGLWGCSAAGWPAIETRIREWLPVDGAPEQAVYYSPATDSARGVVLDGPREYRVEPGEIPATVDAIVFGSAIEVWEYKTGFQANLTDADENEQLAFGCLAVARRTKASGIRGILAHVQDDGTARVTSVDYDSLELDEIAERIRAAHVKIRGAEPCPGPWCADYRCPVRAVCPATRAAIVGTPIEPLSIAIENDAQAASVHERIGAAEDFLAAVKRSLSEYVERRGEIDLPGGKLVWAEESRETISPSGQALALLIDRGLQNAIDYRVTKSGLESELRKTSEGPTAESMRALMRELTDLGAVRTTTYHKLAVRKNRGRKAA